MSKKKKAAEDKAEKDHLVIAAICMSALEGIIGMPDEERPHLIAANSLEAANASAFITAHAAIDIALSLREIEKLLRPKA